MGLIKVSHKDVPLSWNIDIMGRLRAFAQPSQDEGDPLWEPVFLPYELGLRAIYADKMTPDTLTAFISLLDRFQSQSDLTDDQRVHVCAVIADLKTEQEANQLA